MDWQRSSAHRRHLLSYLVCAAVIIGLIAATWWVYQKDQSSHQWWQEVRQQLNPQQIQRRLRSARLLQDAQKALSQQDLAQAEQLLRQAVAADPYNSEAWQLLVSLLVLRQNRWDEAEALVAKVREKKAKADALLLLADIAYLQRDWAKAERFYQQVLKLDPDNATALNNYGYMLAELGERLDEAEAMIRKALKQRPNEPAFLDSLGWVYAQRGDYKKALPLIQKAVRGAPNDAELRYHLGIVYWRLGEKEKALQELRKAIDLDPRHMGAREALQKLEEELQEQEGKGTVRT